MQVVTVRDRVLYLDMDAIHIPPNLAPQIAWRKKLQRMKRLEPFFSQRLMRYKDPEQLRKGIEKYFKSCIGVRYYRGQIMLDEHGEPLKGQVQPYTLSGLARFLHISTQTLNDYEAKANAGLIPPEYAEIIWDARMRIQEYAEKRLYDREGSSGARFVLETSFGWMTDKDRQEIEMHKKRIQLARDKLNFVKQQAEEGKLTDKELTVNILRAGNDD